MEERWYGGEREGERGYGGEMVWRRDGMEERWYEQSEWGWKEREKRDEMKDERAWYLLARDTDSSPVAFSHFRFDVDYEVQLESRVRRKGLGKFLIQILQLIANRFEIDDTSPSMSGCCGDDCTYEILSRRTKHAEAQAEAQGHSHGGGGHCGGCCH
ncbi:unnamed protein product [Coregonus sp. 'balchen']|nr:unnamed protein product [Coregonus sp. 'balchen']